MVWKVFVGEKKIGRLTEPRIESEMVHCTFEPDGSFDRYAPAFASGDIWEAADDRLDAIIDEIAVEGVFLIAADGTEIVDPDLRIDGTDARFTDQSRSST